LTANYSQTSYIENKGNGLFEVKPLPRVAQKSPVNGIVIVDVNSDDNADILMVGNDYGNEVFAGRYDAGTGLVLLGDGKGGFQTLLSWKSGFKVDGDAKALAKLKHASGDELLIATQNLDSLCVFKVRNEKTKPGRIFQPLAFDSHAELHYQNGTREKVEFYYGAGYLSQSTRNLMISPNVLKILVYDYKGNQRTVENNQLALQ
jgi:hypothetical protein